MKINRNFENLQDSYLFAEVENRVTAYKKAHPDKDIIKLGIGDVTLPLWFNDHEHTAEAMQRLQKVL